MWLSRIIYSIENIDSILSEIHQINSKLQDLELRLGNLEEFMKADNADSIDTCEAFVLSKDHYNLLRNGRFAYIEFDEKLFAKTKPLPIMLKTVDWLSEIGYLSYRFRY